MASAAADRAQGVVTRFAPSPTGFLHIGGARTALFNWLYARHASGTYLLRIEDTDRARSTPEAIAAIHDGLAWLGLEGDAPAVLQSARAARHAEVAERLLASGAAYRCYLTPEELAARRAAAEAARQPYRLRSEWRGAPASDAPIGQPSVVRIKAPQSGETTIDDLVQGPITVNNAELDDFVLLRSDGTPTYMLAVVVDDHDMGITHVIRGDDHINNAFRQLTIIRALDALEGGWPDPAYAHIPLIHGADGAKLSKRHGALGVDAYRDELDILPEALFNYLLRLGWGHGDDEIISRAQAIAWFDIKDVGKGPARFDLKKLESLNAHYLRARTVDEIVRDQVPRLEARLGAPLTAAQRETNRRAIPLLQPRASSIGGIVDGAMFLFATRPLALDAPAQALLTPEARALLAAAHATLSDLSDWNLPALEAALKALAEAHGVGLGKLAQPLRAALAGRTTSPGIFDVLVLLGKQESLGRIADQLTVKEHV